MKMYKFWAYDLQGNKTKLAEVADQSQANVLHGYYLQTYKDGKFSITMQIGRQKEQTIIWN